MEHVICSIFDSKAQAWLRPLFFLSIGQAERAFQDSVTDPESQISKHPEDYVLFKMGMWDERNGILIADGPTEITRGLQLAQQPMEVM